MFYLNIRVRPNRQILLNRNNPSLLLGRSADDIATAFREAGHEASVTAMRTGRGQMISIKGHNINTIKVHGGGGRHTLPRVQILGPNGS